MSKIATSTEAVTKLLDTFDNTKENLPTSGHEAAETLFDLGDTMADALQAMLAERDEARAEVEWLKAQPAQTVKVKPLVWEGENGDEYVEALGFRYLLCDPSSSDECRGWYVLEDTTNTVISKDDGCPEAAKAAAQADYEARIMAALDVQPITVQDAARVPEVQALIEAGEKVLHAIGELVANSEGVAGLHMNGEVADWESLLPGGSFGDWLYSVDGLRAALRAIEEGRE